jgi:hypothetical protein
MPETITETMPIALTEAEKARFGELTGKAVEDLSEMKYAAKDAAAESKKKIKKQEEEIYRLSRIVSTGIEWRDIECEVLKDYARGIVRVVRCDTGEVYKERRMTKDEQQMAFDDAVN